LTSRATQKFGRNFDQKLIRIKEDETMKRNRTTSDVEFLIKQVRSWRILTPDYHRGKSWRKSKKQLLINSILQDFAIPSLTLDNTNILAGEYYIIDGKQRIDALVEFERGDFPLAHDVDGYETKGKYYHQLPVELQRRFGRYIFDINNVQMDNPEQLYIRLNRHKTIKNKLAKELAESGTSPTSILNDMGHSNIATTSIYRREPKADDNG
jgi:hypothetical protein